MLYLDFALYEYRLRVKIFWLRFSFILLETLVNNLEFSQVEKQVIDGLKMGNESLKKANEMFSIEEIEQIMDDTAEGVEKQREIEDILSGQLTQDEEDDVLKELNQLEENESIGIAEEIPELPNVPSDKLPPTKEAEAVEKAKSSKTKVLLEAS